MTTENKLAPEYSRNEKFLRISGALLLCLVAVFLGKIYFFPWFDDYIERGHCDHFGSFTGLDIVLYFMFCGLPLLITIALLIFEIPGAVKTISSKQSPYPGKKVYRPTVYKYGRKVLIRPVLLIVFTMMLMGAAISGIFVVDNMMSEFDSSKFPPCVKQ